MGFNSLLFIPNDQLSTVDNNPELFAKEVSRACGSMTNGPLPGSFNSFSVPYIAHADDIGLIAVGGNFAESIYQGYMGHTHGHHTNEGRIELLKKAAECYGYRLVKKKQGSIK